MGRNFIKRRHLCKCDEQTNRLTDGAVRREEHREDLHSFVGSSELGVTCLEYVGSILRLYFLLTWK